MVEGIFLIFIEKKIKKISIFDIPKPDPAKVEESIGDPRHRLEVWLKGVSFLPFFSVECNCLRRNNSSEKRWK